MNLGKTKSTAQKKPGQQAELPPLHMHTHTASPTVMTAALTLRVMRCEAMAPSLAASKVSEGCVTPTRQDRPGSWDALQFFATKSLLGELGGKGGDEGQEKNCMHPCE